MLNPITDQRIGARPERYQRIEIFGIRDILEQIDRWKYRRNELYRLLPRQPFQCWTRTFLRRRQWGSPGPRRGEMRECLVQPDHAGPHHFDG